ncbi:MAG: sigma-70 family RNA polymerase sigma factor [Clostridia bacterium]|nr:sigma-70 family RNA polymerase sigma factor [Clostridia bacterium]
MAYQNADDFDYDPDVSNSDPAPATDVDMDEDDPMHAMMRDTSLPCGDTLPMEVTDEVVRFYSPLVWKLALTKTRSTHDAQDIFQDVFVKLVTNEKPFASEEHRKAWLIRVTINCCNSHFVAPWRRNVDGMDDVMMAQLPDEDTLDTGRSDTPDVYAEVLKLPQQMREVLLLFYYEDMSVREIARVLDTTEVNIKKRLSRARQKLKLALDEHGDSQVQKRGNP